jgi:hypothetical protein
MGTVRNKQYTGYLDEFTVNFNEVKSFECTITINNPIDENKDTCNTEFEPTEIIIKS